MATRASRAGGGRSRKLVNYTWSPFVTAAPITIAPASKALLGFFFLSTAFEETLTRTRGVLNIISDQSGAIEEQVGAFGFIRVTDSAIAAGPASIPGPATDGADDGWAVWVPFAQQTGNSQTQIGLGGAWPIDSKAQRIVREGQQLAVMIENSHATHSFKVLVALRSLSRFRS